MSSVSFSYVSNSFCSACAHVLLASFHACVIVVLWPVGACTLKIMFEFDVFLSCCRSVTVESVSSFRDVVSFLTFPFFPRFFVRLLVVCVC